MDALYFVNAKMRLALLLVSLFSFLSCFNKNERLVLPMMDEEEIKILEFIQENKVRSIAYHHASLDKDDLLVIVSYPSWSNKQIELLGQAVMANAEKILLEYPQISQFTFYAANGSHEDTRRHFLTITRALWENPPVVISNGPIMAYELAQNYFVGPAVKGLLGFKKGKMLITLPPQKPMP